MVIFEDLHWIDEETQALLNLLADSIGTAKLLLLVNYRPEYTHSWGNKTYYTQLRLDPLGKESADEMLSSLIGDGKDLIPLKRLIIERTGGNPFFMEETVQVLLDEGALVRDGAAIRLTKPLSDLKIPPTVQAILAARIDRLPADEKAILQALAVMGKEFKLSLVRAVTAKSDDELNRMLGNLQLAEFIYEQPAVGDIEYSFKHALTQEVAYNSVLMERRKLLHERIGGALETLYVSSLDDHLAELAHHYARSGNPDKAVLYLTRAAQQALNRSAFAEAQVQLQQGLEWIEKLPEAPDRDARELELASLLGQVLTVTRGFVAPEMRAVAERARDLAEKSGNLAQLVVHLFGIWRNVFVAGDYSTAGRLADQILDLAERERSPASFAFACHVQVWVHLIRGNLVAAEEHFARGSGFLDAEGFRQIPDAAEGTIAPATLCAVALGRVDLARERIAQTLALAHNPFELATGRMWEAWLSCLLREPQRAEAAATQAVAIADEHGFRFHANFSRPMLGWAQAQLGRTDEGIALIRDGLAGLAKAGSGIAITDSLTRLAEAQALDGAIDDALSTIEEALQPNPEELFFRPNALNFRGELRLKLGRTELAETDFRDAIALAQKTKAKTWELRATTSLARLLASHGRHAEARATLAEIYNWFTEGFDTADLKDAKALLEELNA
jgi:tetratricopeptide (TPR) repeat protein